jgi:hypothetical protein
MPFFLLLTPKQNSKMRFESYDFVGIAKPKESTEIPFTVTCTEVGELVGRVE